MLNNLHKLSDLYIHVPHQILTTFDLTSNDEERFHNEANPILITCFDTNNSIISSILITCVNTNNISIISHIRGL